MGEWQIGEVLKRILDSVSDWAVVVMFIILPKNWTGD